MVERTTLKEYRRILVATDFSPASEAAARRAVALARQSGARLLLLHVIAHFPEDIPVAPIAPEGADIGEFLRAHAQNQLTAFATRVEAGEAERKVALTLEGRVVGIVEAAEAANIDLIVIGAHGRRGMVGWLGSTAAAVVQRARCDVLVVRPNGTT